MNTPHPDMRTCSICQVSKPIDRFRLTSSKVKKDGSLYRYTFCSRCKNKKDRKRPTYKRLQSDWKEKNKERMRGYVKSYNLRNPGRVRLRVRKSSLKRKYGISLIEYNNMSASQDGLCAICSSKQKDHTRKLAVDHCHSTGKIRGLLCDFCNRGIGSMNDSVQTLESAIAYLKSNQAS